MRYIVVATGASAGQFEEAPLHKTYGIYDQERREIVESYWTLKAAEDAAERRNHD